MSFLNANANDDAEEEEEDDGAKNTELSGSIASW